jgi:predicted deacylase
MDICCLPGYKVSNNMINNKVHYSFLKLMTGYDLALRRIPVMEIESKLPGPLIVLTGCIHGDEIGGTVVIHELFKVLKKELLCGKIFAFPLLNPFGFETASRRISISNEDLNRSFPGKNKGTLAQRIAFRVMEKVQELQPQLVLDLHNDWNKSIPYTVIDPLEHNSNLSDIHHYAMASGLPSVQEPEKIPTSFSYSLNNIGIPALTLELGESLTINEKNVVYGLNAVLNILSELKMVHDMEKTNFILPEAARNKILMYSSEPLCSSSGIIRFLKKPGDLIQKGDKIAKVFNAFGGLIETIVSCHNGIILGHNDYALAFPGSPVMAFGVIK